MATNQRASSTAESPHRFVAVRFSMHSRTDQVTNSPTNQVTASQAKSPLLGPHHSIQAPQLDSAEHRERDREVVPFGIDPDVGGDGDFADDRSVATVGE